MGDGWMGGWVDGWMGVCVFAEPRRRHAYIGSSRSEKQRPCSFTDHRMLYRTAGVLLCRKRRCEPRAGRQARSVRRQRMQPCGAVRSKCAPARAKRVTPPLCHGRRPTSDVRGTDRFTGRPERVPPGARAARSACRPERVSPGDGRRSACVDPARGTGYRLDAHPVWRPCRAGRPRTRTDSRRRAAPTIATPDNPFPRTDPI